LMTCASSSKTMCAFSGSFKEHFKTPNANFQITNKFQTSGAKIPNRSAVGSLRF
jgi:hypothetical protein